MNVDARPAVATAPSTEVDGMTAHAGTHAFDDPAVPHPARRYNYWLGGREN